MNFRRNFYPEKKSVGCESFLSKSFYVHHFLSKELIFFDHIISSLKIKIFMYNFFLSLNYKKILNKN